MNEWTRCVGTIHDNDGVARCECCGGMTLKAWTNGEIVMCEDCLEMGGIDPDRGHSLDSALL